MRHCRIGAKNLQVAQKMAQKKCVGGGGGGGGGATQRIKNTRNAP